MSGVTVTISMWWKHTTSHLEVRESEPLSAPADKPGPPALRTTCIQTSCSLDNDILSLSQWNWGIWNSISSTCKFTGDTNPWAPSPSSWNGDSKVEASKLGSPNPNSPEASWSLRATHGSHYYIWWCCSQLTASLTNRSSCVSVTATFLSLTLSSLGNCDLSVT